MLIRPIRWINFSGPHWRTLPWAAFSGIWGGQVAVEGNTVRYVNVNVGGEVAVDAVFTVAPDGVRMELTQRTNSNRPTIELEAWRFVWNAHQSAVATLAQPICTGRTGAATLPLVWCAPGHGALSCSVVESSAPVRVQADSHRGAHITFAGLVLGSASPYPTRTFEPGTTEYRAVFELRPEPILPILQTGTDEVDLHPAIRREWGSGLMFRPELAGFSNNSLSTNCHLSQSGVVDLACFTGKPDRGPDPVELSRHTITMALKDGRGYGADRDIYIDSDPALLIAVRPNPYGVAEQGVAERHMALAPPDSGSPFCQNRRQWPDCFSDTERKSPYRFAGPTRQSPVFPMQWLG